MNSQNYWFHTRECSVTPYVRSFPRNISSTFFGGKKNWLTNRKLDERWTTNEIWQWISRATTKNGFNYPFSQTTFISPLSETVVWFVLSHNICRICCVLRKKITMKPSDTKRKNWRIEETVLTRKRCEKLAFSTSLQSFDALFIRRWTFLQD